MQSSSVSVLPLCHFFVSLSKSDLLTTCGHEGKIISQEQAKNTSLSQTSLNIQLRVVRAPPREHFATTQISPAEGAG